MAPHATIDSESGRSQRPNVAGHNACAPYPSLPFESPCLSFWHRTTRAFEYLDCNSDSSVPGASKYVIIGSGLSGSLTAWELLEAGIEGPHIVILEAREAVSGASGRNAGHVRPGKHLYRPPSSTIWLFGGPDDPQLTLLIDAFRGFSAYAATHGRDQAKKIIENEKLVFERIGDFVQKHNVPCDFHPTTTFDVCLTPEFAKYEAESLEAYKSAGGNVSHVKFYDGDEARQRTKVASAVAAYEWPAGSSHPAKLTQWLLKEAIGRGVRLWTHCPAVAIEEHSPRGSGDSARWDVRTPRGTIAAETVAHCSNAYSAYLLPELSSFVTPNKAQAHSFIPTSSLSGANAVSSTMSLRYSLGHFFSLIQRLGDGIVVFGVSRNNPEWSEDTKASIVGFDDTYYIEEVAATAEREFFRLFPNASTRARRHGEGADHYWSGIIAMTPDSVPMVGKIEGREGQWICAGFNGHGMARIFTCAPGLVKLMMGEPWQATGLPECFEYGRSRLERAAKDNLKSIW